MNPTQSPLLADLILDGKKSAESGLYISEMTLDEGISQVSKAVLTVCSKSLSLKLRGKKDQNGNQAEKGLLDYLDKKATICFLDNEKISRTFTGKITSVTHLGVSNTASGNLYKYEFIVEPSIIDMKFAHHTRQIKKTIQETLKEILSNYYGNTNIDFVTDKPDTNSYLFFQQNETDYDFFTRLLSQFGLSYFVCSQKNQNSDEYYEQIIISDGKSFELPISTRPANSHIDRNLNILVNTSSKTKSKNIRISSWQMSNSITVDKICRTDSLKNNEKNKRLWFLDSLAAPHSETQTDDKTREKVADNYLNSLRSNSANWFGTAHINDFQATDILNIFDFYSPCNLDSEEKEKSALVSEDTIRARIISLNLQLTNVLPFGVDSSNTSPTTEVKFRCAEISKDAPSGFTTLGDKNALYSDDSSNKTKLNYLALTNNANDGVSLRKATVCYPPDTSEEVLKASPTKNTPAKINIDPKTGESYFYAKIDNSNTCSEVLFTMPLAGLGQGLYRYPRIGERILVLDNKDSRYVLHGYIPDTKTMPFFQYGTVQSDDEIEAILKEQGVLTDSTTADKKKQAIDNYKNQQKAVVAGQQLEQSVATVLRHSSNNFIIETETNGVKTKSEAEITNYLAEESSQPFAASLKKLERNVAGLFNPSDYNTKDIKYSEIGMYSGSSYYDKKGNQLWSPETLRIQTPGNQFNHTGLMNLNTANSFIFTTPNAPQDVGFGAFQVIDVGSVVIDAQKSITFRVGGNMINISESGVNITSQSTYTQSTAYDSTLSLSPIGASLSGLDVNVTGTTSTNISDGLGASMALAKGGVAISGHTVDLSTIDHYRVNWDIFFIYFDVAKYAARFIADQALMKKRINIGYNDMVKDGYFNPLTLVERMTGGLSDGLIKGLATYNAAYGFFVIFEKIKTITGQIFTPMRGNSAIYFLQLGVDFLLGIFDAFMGLLSADVYGAGALKSLTPEQVQRQITITNFIKIAIKFFFLSFKFSAYKKYQHGDISYLMIDSEEIQAFSSKLTTDFVKVKATAHNVPINPFNEDRQFELDYQDIFGDSIASLSSRMISAELDKLRQAKTATEFEMIKKASGIAPAFALSSDDGSVSLDSRALKSLKANIITVLAGVNAESGTKAEVNVKSPSIELKTVSAQTNFNATGKLDISSNLTTKISSGESSIEILPASIKLASTLLDEQAATLQMKAEAALKIDGGATKFESNIFDIKGEIANLKTKLTKVG